MSELGLIVVTANASKLGCSRKELVIQQGHAFLRIDILTVSHLVHAELGFKRTSDLFCLVLRS